MNKSLRNKPCILIIVILSLGLILSACSSNETVKKDQQNESMMEESENMVDDNDSEVRESNYSGDEGKINVYISGPEQMIKKLEEEFEKDRGDVVDFLHMGCGPLRQKVWTEKEAGEIQADVVWGSDPLMYMALENEGLLQKYTSKEFEFIKDEYKVGDGYYTLASERYGVIIYNKDNANQIPKSFESLKDKAWDSAIIMADATQSSTALALNSSLYQMSGDNFDYLKALFDNNLFLTKKNGEVSSKIAQGEFDAGIAPHDGVLRLKKKAKKEGYNMPIDIAWPKEGVIAIQRPIAVIKNEARPKVNDELSKEFVDFILSKKVQSITTKFGFVSVRKDIKLPTGVPTDIKIVSVDWKFASEHEKEIRDGYENIVQER